MKTHNHIVTFLFIAVMLLTACKKEGALTPSEEPENVVGDHTLPQGNHPYDATILQLFQRYNSLFLYKYAPSDLYYNITTWSGGSYDPVKNETTRPGLFDVPADEDFVGMQLDLLKESWLKYYSDDLLKKGLPKKVILLDSIFYSGYGPGTPVEWLYYYYDAHDGGDYFAVSWGGPRVQNITAEEKYLFKGTMNSVFLRHIHRRNIIKHTSAFVAMTDYSAVTSWNYWEHGIINYKNGGAAEDWDYYVDAIVSNTYTTLTAPGNILDPATDTKGLYRKKYKAVIDYFQNELSIDLQAIGNAGG